MRQHQLGARLLLITILQLVAGTSRKRQSGPTYPIRGVNLGGWLVTEQWITPSLYESTSAADEWHLCNELGKSKCLSTLQNHWSSFYTRADMVDVHNAGLNAVRIPVGFWAVNLADYEPYVSGQYPYLIRAVRWAGELGLSVLIDLHGAPGSQNGQDNSGLIGPVDFPANSSNAERSLRVLRNLTEEFSQGIYGSTVVGIELLNEPRLSTPNFPMDQLKDFYGDGYSVVRNSTNRGDLNVTVHDAFYGPAYWTDYNPQESSSAQPAPHLTVDTHQYYAFAPLSNFSHSEILASICNLSQTLKQTNSGIPPTLVGEFSLQSNSSTAPHISDGDISSDQIRRTWFRLFFEAQRAAYEPNGPGQSSIGWIYWAWKTEYDIDTWSYRRGLAQGYIPSDASNASTLAFPLMQNGCVDESYNYTAPRHVGAASVTTSHRWLWISFIGPALLLCGWL